MEHLNNKFSKLNFMIKKKNIKIYHKLLLFFDKIYKMLIISNNKLYMHYLFYI